MDQNLTAFLQAALVASCHISPRSPGLTAEELRESTQRAGYKHGETNDALAALPKIFTNGKWNLPPSSAAASFSDFAHEEEPEYRNWRAFDAVRRILLDLAKDVGITNARMSRDVLVEKAAADGLDRTQVEAAITLLLLDEFLLEENGGLIRHANTGYALPSAQIQQRNEMGGRIYKNDNPALRRAYPIVQDVIARRTDGRSSYAEPLDAFAQELETLGYGQFRLWWTQTVAELRQLETHTPVAICVLSAALVEGSLTFVVKHARSLGGFASTVFAREPRFWKIDDLVTSAAMGGVSAVLNQPAKQRAEVLIKTRQRIHAGRMLSEYPTGAPDLRPEEARDAKATAELVVRCVLDWLHKYPAGQ